MGSGLSRRSWLQLAGFSSLSGAAVAAQRLGDSTGASPAAHGDHGAHRLGTVGRVSTDRFDPTAYLRSWNFSHLPEAERQRYYKETPRPDGSLLREYQLFAVDR